MEYYICILLILLVVAIYVVIRAELEDVGTIEHYGGADRGNGLLPADTVEQSASIGWTSMRNAHRTISGTCGTRLQDCESPIHGRSGDSAASMSRYMVRD